MTADAVETARAVAEAAEHAAHAAAVAEAGLPVPAALAAFPPPPALAALAAKKGVPLPKRGGVLTLAPGALPGALGVLSEATAASATSAIAGAPGGKEERRRIARDAGVTGALSDTPGGGTALTLRVDTLVGSLTT
jgi:hypothetical protein